VVRPSVAALAMAEVAYRVREPEEAVLSSPGPASRYRGLQLVLIVLRGGPALILLLLVVVFTLTTPVFFTTRNVGNVLSQTAVYAILGMGQLLVIISRGIDLSVGSTLALSGVLGAVVFQGTNSTILTVLAVLGTGLGVGLVNGLTFVLGRIPHPFIVTVASLTIVRGLAYISAPGATFLASMSSAVNTLGGGSIGWFPYSSFVVIGVALLVVAGTTYMVWGRWLYSVGGNPEAARRAGIPVGAVLVSVYAISGLLAGVSGLLNDGLLGGGSPTAGDGYELYSIAAVIIGGAAFSGGRGNVGNALVGAFTIGVINNALNLHNVNAFIQMVAIGMIVVVAVEGDVIRRHVEDRVRLARAVRHG
jgi:ribose transport system permease protein